MLVSLFPSITETHPHPRRLDWATFARELGPHDFTRPTKDGVPAFSPAEYPPGASRAKGNVTRVHFGVLDIDKVPESEIARLTELLTDVAFIFYTTWSHPKHAPRWCARLIIPFTRPVLTSEWATFWPRFNHRFGGLGDPACKDPSRLYFIPAAPAGTEETAHFECQDGASLNPDELLSAPIPAREQRATEHISLNDVQALSGKLKRRKSPHHQKLGRRLGQLIEGEPFAETGERDEIIFKLTGVLIDEWPKAQASLLASYFAPSLTKMGPDGLTVEDVEAKLKRHQEQALEQASEHEQSHIREERRIIRQAFGNGRDYPYTPEELDHFTATHGDLRNRWVIQKSRTFYLFFAGSYLPPCTDADVVSSAVRDLSPAPVELWKISRTGELLLKTPNEMVREHGSVASTVSVSLNAQRSSYDEKSRTFTEAPCPMRETIQPTYDPEVDEWLKWLTGGQYETVSDWLSVVTRLDEPCAALYLDGAPGVGKTLLADGLARIWSTDRPTAFEQALADFNDGLTACPLVLADESVPRDFRGRVRTAELRQFIQARSRPLKRKFQPDSTLIGCTRLIITANNRELLASTENLTANDIGAIVDRLIYVQCGTNAGRYLNSLGPRVVSEFVRGDRIAKHALWLGLNRTVTRGKRFLVEGTDSALHRSLTTSSGMRSAVCNWLVGYLLQPEKMDALNHKLVRIHEGRVLATSRGLARWWDMYETNVLPPPAGVISSALSGLATDKKQLRAGDGRQTNYWVIDPTNLITWADANGYATEETIKEALSSRSQS